MRILSLLAQSSNVPFVQFTDVPFIEVQDALHLSFRGPGPWQGTEQRHRGGSSGGDDGAGDEALRGLRSDAGVRETRRGSWTAAVGGDASAMDDRGRPVAVEGPAALRRDASAAEGAGRDAAKGHALLEDAPDGRFGECQALAAEHDPEPRPAHEGVVAAHLPDPVLVLPGPLRTTRSKGPCALCGQAPEPVPAAALQPAVQGGPGPADGFERDCRGARRRWYSSIPRRRSRASGGVVSSTRMLR